MAIHMNAMFRYVSDVHTRTARQTCKTDLYIPSKARLNVFMNKIRYSISHIWNKLLRNELPKYVFELTEF